MLLFFFFQAEDGIRDLVRSRGLGDVYKRQDPLYVANEGKLVAICAEADAARLLQAMRAHPLGAVSYTHLTLPTSDLV